jgi:hypothetical protein
VGLQAEVDQLGMFRVVVMFFLFDTWIGDVSNLDIQPNFCAGFLDDSGYLQDRKSFSELIVNATLAGRGWVQAGQLNAADGISNIEEPSLLAAFTVDG